MNKLQKLRVSINAPVTLIFTLLCLFALISGTISSGWTTTQLFEVYRCPLSDPLAYIRFFGHVLGHSGYSHFINNIVLILVLGPSLEERYGRAGLCFVILLTALISGLVQFAFFPSTALLGASGVVFAMILLSSFSGAKQGTIPLTLLLVAVFYIGGEVKDALTAQDNISHMAHIIGGLCGTGVGFWFGRVKS